jgi:hypothetical protein
MNTKFTKGPWIKDKRNENLVGSNGECVTIWGCGLTNSYRSEITTANAYLIAATPDMYAEIQSDINDLEDRLFDVSKVSGDYDLINSRIKHKKSLLAKARGELK